MNRNKKYIEVPSEETHKILGNNKAEHALKTSELRYRRLFETAQDGILLIDFNTGMILDANKFLIDMLGYSKSAFLKKHLWEVGVFKDIAASKDNFLTLQTKRYVRFEDLPLETKDGRKINVEFVANAYKVDKTQVIQCNIRDISDRKMVEQKLIAERAKDEALLECIGDAVIATDQEGKVIVFNRIAEGLLGFMGVDMIGEYFIRALTLQDAQGNQIHDSLQPLTLALTQGVTTTNHNFYFIRKDGTKIPVSTTIAPVILGSKATGAIVVFRDITREQEMEKLQMDFLSLASHQLRTPLSGTKWLIDTMQMGILGSMTGKQKEYLDYLYKINERMIRLVSDMLNVLMLEGGAAVIKKQEVPVYKLYEEIFLMMEPAAQSKGVTLRNAFENNKTLSVQSNLQALRSILESFVSNSINYSQDGQEVFLDAKEESDDVVFSIKDSGIGIPKEEHKRIFERFYRASNAKEFKPDGTGLGLYTAFLLAQKVGGKISFESENNEGTTFYLRLPKKVHYVDNNQTEKKLN